MIPVKETLRGSHPCFPSPRPEKGWHEMPTDSTWDCWFIDGFDFGNTPSVHALVDLAAFHWWRTWLDCTWHSTWATHASNPFETAAMPLHASTILYIPFISAAGRRNVRVFGPMTNHHWPFRFCNVPFITVWVSWPFCSMQSVRNSYCGSKSYTHVSPVGTPPCWIPLRFPDPWPDQTVLLTPMGNSPLLTRPTQTVSTNKLTCWKAFGPELQISIISPSQAQNTPLRLLTARECSLHFFDFTFFGFITWSPNLNTQSLSQWTHPDVHAIHSAETEIPNHQWRPWRPKAVFDAITCNSRFVPTMNLDEFSM